MGFIGKILAFTFNHSAQADLPTPTFASSAAFKTALDSQAVQCQTAINSVIDQLNSVIALSSGAENLGSAPITGVTGATIHEQLKDIKAQLTGLVLGTIPDASISEAKLAFAIATQAELDAVAALKLNLSGGTMTGAVAYGRNDLQQPKIKDYSEVVSTNAAATGAVTLDMANGNVFDNTLTGATTFTFSNPAPTGQASSFTLLLRQGATAYAVTWPASVKWANDVIPDISAINKTSVLTFVTINGGTRWYGFLAANGLVT